MSSSNRTLVLAGFILATLTSANPCASAQPSHPVVAISGVEVKLFYANSGRFSSNLATKKDISLWNVVIGEGMGIEGPSENTLLLISVLGPPREQFDDLHLKVTAKTEEGTLLERTNNVGAFNTNGNWYAPFLLYGTGCLPVTVRATLTSGKESNPPIEFVIPFQCGE